MCDEDKSKIVLYRSSNDFDTSILKEVHKAGKNLEYYTDENYQELANARIKTSRKGQQ